MCNFTFYIDSQAEIQTKSKVNYPQDCCAGAALCNSKTRQSAGFVFVQDMTDLKEFCTAAIDTAIRDFNPSGTQAERGHDLVKKLFVHRSRLIRAQGIHVSADQVGTTVPLEIVSDLLCPRGEFPRLGVLIRLGGLVTEGRVRQAGIGEPLRCIEVIVQGFALTDLHLQQGFRCQPDHGYRSHPPPLESLGDHRDVDEVRDRSVGL